MQWLSTRLGSACRGALLAAECPARHYASRTRLGPACTQPSRVEARTRWSSTVHRAAPFPANVAKPHYTTTPIFYVNASPHVGHLYTIVLADVFSRWAQWRHRGWSATEPWPSESTTAVLATGTDEHGIKIQKVAEAAGEEPRALCDRVSKRFEVLADAAGLRYTRFIRTTDADHVKAVEQIWTELAHKGYIYKGKHEGWYSTSDEAFYTSTQISPSSEDASKMVSIETGSAVEWSSEDNYKFRLSSMKEPLLQWLNENPTAVVPATRRDALIAEIESGLSDLSVSRPRSRLHWGIAVPGDNSHTIYVWLDALMNYMTVSGYPWTNSKASNCWPSDVQVIGKDILRFHAVYFPAFLMALGLPLPRHTVTHGHWTMNKSKMSKSRGNVADPFAAIESFERDSLRWLLCRLGGNIESDADWSERVMAEYHRKYLQGQLGNLASRIMAPKLLSSLLEHAKRAERTKSSGEEASYLTLMRPATGGDTADKELEELLLACAPSFSSHMDRFEIHRALDVIEDLLAACNRMLQRTEPWRLKPGGDEAQDQNNNRNLDAYETIWRSVYLGMETSRICALLLRPIMPDKMEQLLAMLHVTADGRDNTSSWQDACELRSAVQLLKQPKKVVPLFPRLTLPDVE